jgi:hypothetical protein
MDTGKRLDRSGTRTATAVKRTVVIGIVLAAIGYGTARMGGHSSTLPAEAAAAGPAREATLAMRPAAPEGQIRREEDPRPCEPERGIAERCTY